MIVNNLCKIFVSIFVFKWRPITRFPFLSFYFVLFKFELFRAVAPFEAPSCPFPSCPFRRTAQIKLERTRGVLLRVLLRVLACPSLPRVGCVWGYRRVTSLHFLLPPFSSLLEVGALKVQNFLKLPNPPLSGTRFRRPVPLTSRSWIFHCWEPFP